MLQVSDDMVSVCLVDESALMALPGFTPENIGRAAAGYHNNNGNNNNGSSSSGSLTGESLSQLAWFVMLQLNLPPLTHLLIPPEPTFLYDQVACRSRAVVSKATRQSHH